MNPICPACGEGLTLLSRFCHACGVRVPERVQPPPGYESPAAYTPRHLAERILTSRSAMEGEHKRVSVLFCDIVNSTPLAERLGDEAMHELVNRLFEQVLEIVHRYTGTVNQFLGDGFMALFGAPLAVEQHERHAVRAALDIRAHVAAGFGDVLQRTGHPLQVRLGINAGAVVVGKIGDNLRMDYTAIGDTTNVAARLQALAGPGDLMVSQTTYAAIAPIVQAESLGLVVLKGKSEPVEVHRVLGLSSVRGGMSARGAQRPLSRFVGRDRDLEDLGTLLDEVLDGHGRAACIVSEPGMGKSRLLWEFRQSLVGRDLLYLEGQCVSYGASSPHLPVLDLLRAACGIEEAAGAELIRPRLHEATAAVGLDPETAVPALMHLLGAAPPEGPLLGLSPEALQSRTEDALRQFVLRSSARRPLVIAIEDLHWVDRSSERTIDALVQSLAGARILLLVTCRPGHSPAWLTLSYASQLSLRPLPRSGGEAIVRSVLERQGLAPGAVRAIVDRAEGNPLFLEELANAVGEQRADAASRVPDTLQGVLASRIDRLGDGTKRALQWAAVIGREFPASLLSAVWRHEDSDLAEELQRLVRLEFIYERAADAQGVYLFKHALTRDAAYASLLGPRRRASHRAVGEALEAQNAERIDELVELLAHQFSESDDDAKAVAYATRASQRAQARWANTEALAFADAALRRLQAMPASESTRVQQIDLVIQQAEVRFALGQHAQQLAALEEVGRLVREDDEPARRAAWHYWVGFLGSITGAATRQAIGHCEAASAIAKASNLEVLGARADCCLAQAHFGEGALLTAIEVGERALAVFEMQGDVWWSCRALAQLNPAANAAGDWSRSLAYCQQAIDHGRRSNDLRLKVSSFIRLASTQIQLGDFEAGLRNCEVAESFKPVEYDAAALRAIRGYGRIKAGQVQLGVADVRQSLAWFTASSQRFTQAQFSTWMAEGLMALGELGSAVDILRGVLASSDAIGYPYLSAIANRMLAACLRDSDPSVAARHLRDAIHLCKKVGARAELEKAGRLLAAFGAANDQFEEVRTC